MSKQIISFDIGIKNLAWCVTSLSGERFHVLSWGNYNLLEEKQTESEVVKQDQCGTCSAKARFQNIDGLCCARHAPLSKPIWKDLSGTAYTKIPPVKDIRSFLSEKGVRPLPKTKEQLHLKLQEYVSIPIQKKKIPHAAAIDVQSIHDSLRRYVRKELSSFFQTLTEARIENQPAFKNPVMKTIQMLLFATLRDAIYEVRKGQMPNFKLVHAGNKVKGAATGDKGYKARKDGSEQKVKETLTKKNIVNRTEWLMFFEKHKKRSDLADAFCMCLDAYDATALKDA